MKKILALSWVAFMIILTLSSAIAIAGAIFTFLINTVGWLPIVALFGLGSGMTILFKITTWADNVLDKGE